MKKKLILFAVSLFSLLVSCTPSDSDLVVAEDNSISTSIEKLKKGVRFEGTLTQTRSYYSDASFSEKIENTSSNDESNISNLVFMYTDDAISRYIELKSDTTGDEFVTYLSDAYFKDELGYSYTESLGIDNEVKRNYLTSDSNKVTFKSLGYDNPFNYIKESNLTKIDDVNYSLDLNVASLIFHNMLSFYSTGISNSPKEASVTINANNEITSITYSPSTRYVAETSDTSEEISYYAIEQKVNLLITDNDEDLISPISKESVKGAENNELNFALSSFDGNKVKIAYREFTKSNDSYASTNEYNTYRYDGSLVYAKYYGQYVGSSSSLDSENDYLLTKNPSLNTYEARKYIDEYAMWLPSNDTNFGKLNQDKYVYSDFISNLNKVSSDLFTYDSETNTYVCTNENCVSSIATEGISPNLSALASTKLEYTNRIEISLNNENQIKTIVCYYSYINYFTESGLVSGKIEINYSNHGTNTMPSFAYTENLSN